MPGREIEDKKTRNGWVLPAVFLVAGALVGWLVGHRTAPSAPVTGGEQVDMVKKHPASASNYKFVKPLLGCGVDPAARKAFLENVGLTSKIEKTIADAKSAGGADKVSAYYVDLENGHWSGVDEDDQFVPASMFKVPTMMAFLHKAEEDPTILAQRVKFASEAAAMTPQEIPATKAIVDGQEYSVDDLIGYMIMYSDNRATESLNQLESKEFNGSYVDTVTDLGIPAPKQGTEFQVSPKQFTLFLRVLYNATYLSAGMSEKALGLLSRSDFDKGLRAGVPADVVVAHKFGEYADLSKNDPPRQLHDCGIVYAPAGPYALCVMTQGRAVDGLERTISAVSSAVYGEVGKK